MFCTTGIGATFRVSADESEQTAADRRLPNTDVVLALLKWIERYMLHRKPRFSRSASFDAGLRSPSPTATAVEAMEAEVRMAI